MLTLDCQKGKKQEKEERGTGGRAAGRKKVLNVTLGNGEWGMGLELRQLARFPLPTSHFPLPTTLVSQSQSTFRNIFFLGSSKLINISECSKLVDHLVMISPVYIIYSLKLIQIPSPPLPAPTYSYY